MHGEDLKLVSIIRAAAIGLTLIVALLLPGGYFALQYTGFVSSAQIRAEVKGETLEQLISSTPEMWMFQEHRLREMLQRHHTRDLHEWLRLVGPEGEEIVSVGQPVGFPSHTFAVGIFDSGLRVANLVVTRSLSDLFLQTAAVALLGLVFGLSTFKLLSVLPRRAQRLNDRLFTAKERAEVTLHSIGDAVVTTTTDQTILYLNPVAERLTGWSLDDARDRHVDEVLQLIDEETLEPAENPLDRAVAENCIRTFGRQTALLRRDGTSIAIEDSAAPIRDRSGQVIGGVIVFHDVSAARSMAQRLTWQATHDALTGLVNRREFESRVDDALARARSSEVEHVVCYMDLDQFKVVNDTCGHAAGDELLKQISSILQSKVRESDTLARLGGDEFGLLLDSCPLERGRLIANHLLAEVQAFCFNWEDKVFSVGVSIGIAAIGPNSEDRADIISAADSALFSAKDQGRNRVCVFRSADAEMSNRRREMDWISRINSALAEERLTLFYQSYQSLTEEKGGDVHIEVLLRMIDEEGQLVLPGSFIPAAERYNLMPSVDRWVIGQVFNRYPELVTRFGGGPLTCAINLSGSSINAEGFLDYIVEQAKVGLPPGAICFEITETAAINNLRKAAEFMQEIKALGFKFALDDFGTGTSSFGYLKNLPVDYLKIDGGFVKNLVADPLDRAMTETINRIGHIVGLRTVAEFAEDQAIISELKTIGVDFAQGYGVEMPSPLFPHSAAIQKLTSLQGS